MDNKPKAQEPIEQPTQKPKDISKILQEDEGDGTSLMTDLKKKKKV